MEAASRIPPTSVPRRPLVVAASRLPPWFRASSRPPTHTAAAPVQSTAPSLPVRRPQQSGGAQPAAAQACSKASPQRCSLHPAATAAACSHPSHDSTQNTEVLKSYPLPF
ncbi:hypothetical protein ZWY2020_055323 [Hordeum vulgare]|nr:hypothetical protein ZWY2020_055323 [Hordeum vulgare]